MTPIRKRGRLYWLDVFVGGKRHRVSLQTDQYYHAIDKAREIERQLGKEAKAGPAVSIADFGKKYLIWASNTKPASVVQESQRLRKITAFLAGQNVDLLSAVTPYHMEQLRGHLRAEGKSKATVNRYLQICRGMFYRAIEWGDFSGQNPLRRVKFYREQSDVKALTGEQVEAVRAAAASIATQKRTSPAQRAFPALVDLALNTGLRRAEALNLRWKDVRMDAREISVTGKGDKRRTVPLNSAALAVISRQPRIGGEFVFDVPYRNQAGVFRKVTAAIAKKVGFPFHYHLLRHTFASRLLGSGVDIVTIAEILGHSKSMVALIYSHSDPARKQAAVGRLNEATVTVKPSQDQGMCKKKKSGGVRK